MIKLKKIKLKNYCGYKDFELDLTEDGSVKTWAMFYGPNGSFKSTFLWAVDLLASPSRFLMKKNILTFRRLKYHKDYATGSEALYSESNELRMEAIFDINGKEKKVVLEDNIKGVIYAGRQVDKEKGEISGIRINELDNKEQGIIFIDADSRNMMNKFQIISNLEEPFCDFASAVYGFKCYCPKESKVIDHGITYLLDFVIEKPDKNNSNNITKVHYKRFSDGEKKIATLISSLFKRGYKSSPDRENKSIICVDNVAMHIYYLRHINLIKKMEEYFPEKQFIVTTHSPVLINKMEKKYLINME